jgi:hypothetical protein
MIDLKDLRDQLCIAMDNQVAFYNKKEPNSNKAVFFINFVTLSYTPLIMNVFRFPFYLVLLYK